MIACCVALFLLYISLCSCSTVSKNKIDLGDISNLELTENDKIIIAIDSCYKKNDFSWNDSLYEFNKEIGNVVVTDLSLKVENKEIDFKNISSCAEPWDVLLTRFVSEEANNFFYTSPYYSYPDEFNNIIECVAVISKDKPNLYGIVNKDIAIRLYDGSISKLINKWFTIDN